MSELATEDFAGVELLRAGVRVHGVGSPPEGDLWTRRDLERIALAARELKGEVRAPLKLGHSRDQRLLREAGMEPPAAGWVDNLRVQGEALVGDLRRVPRKLASLIRAGTFRTRSLELSKVTSERTGEKYDLVVTGLALLGARAPAVRTLDDVVALYEAAEPVRVLTAAAAPAELPYLSRREADELLDEAIADGRLDLAERDEWERDLEAHPEMTVRHLEAMPADAWRAQRNLAATDPEADARERAEISAHLGIRIEEVL